MIDKQLELKMEETKNLKSKFDGYTLLQYSTSTCPPCNVAKEELSKGLFIRYEYINIDRNRGLLPSGVRSVPAFYLQKGEEMTFLKTGWAGRKQLEELIEKTILGD